MPCKQPSTRTERITGAKKQELAHLTQAGFDTFKSKGWL